MIIYFFHLKIFLTKKKKNFHSKNSFSQYFLYTMTSTLIVIGLITCLKVSDKTLFGEAIYREKISSQNYTFEIKQFTNA